MRLAIAMPLLTAALAWAQPIIAPTDVPTEPALGRNIGGYNVRNTFETGYRFRDVTGNLGKYRSDVNFGNGVRLLGSSLSVHSREGQGGYFDELLFNTQGLGNDPYQFSSFRLRKSRLYSYDMLWRLNEYFNPALPIASEQHLMDTTRAMQDHSLVLLPTFPFRLLLGFSRVNQNGGALSTTNLFGTLGDEFPLFADVRRRQNEWRIGFEFQALGARLSIMRIGETFRDDTRRTSPGHPGLDPENETSLSLLRRDEPYHGFARNWRGALIYDRSRVWALNGRFTWANARRNFIFDETAVGVDRFGGARNRQILVFGDGRRPVSNGGLTLTLFPSKHVTVANHTAFHHTRMEGDGAYREIDNGFGFASANFGFLGIRTITNSTDAQVRASKVLSIFSGYQFSTRRIRSTEHTAFEGIPEAVTAEQENTLHSGRAGVRLQPVIPLTMILEAEIGRADRPVFPISERNYHLLGGRIQYKWQSRDRQRSLLLGVNSRAHYNFNSASLLAHSARSRLYAGDMSFTLNPRVSFDANYSKLHLDTLTGIAYFFERQLIQGDRSSYISNVHTGHAGVRIAVSRVDFFGGYSRVQDTGAGNRPIYAAPYVIGASPTPIGPGTLGISAWPLTFESPFARVSILLRNRLRWNVGYQYYRYGEEVLPQQNYRAHTGYGSLSWSF